MNEIEMALFRHHEDFIYRLCGELGLVYEDATHDDIIAAICSLRQMAVYVVTVEALVDNRTQIEVDPWISTERPNIRRLAEDIAQTLRGMSKALWLKVYRADEVKGGPSELALEEEYTYRVVADGEGCLTRVR